MPNDSRVARNTWLSYCWGSLVISVALVDLLGVTADWSVAAEALRERRNALGRTQREAADQGHVSMAVWQAFENRQRSNFSGPTLSKLARGVDWRADALQRINAGEDPAGLVIAPEARPGTAAELVEIRRRLRDVEAGLQRVLDRLEDG